MRETPPYSLAEIRLLLSQYIDGAMEAEQMLGIDALLAQFPDYQAEFLKLQAMRGLIQKSVEAQTEVALADSETPNPLWQAIAGELEADRQTTPGSYDPEWVSAYLDGEIPSLDPQRLAFERQLANNPQANQLLAGLGQVSETVRQFGYRAETACTVDLSSQVMAAFLAEQSPPAQQANDLKEHDPEWELLSGFTDQALSPREVIQATQLIESSEAARGRLLQLNHLSEGIQRVSQQLQHQAPDVWPQVSEALQATAHEQKVVSLSSRRLHWARRAAVPVAAAVVLILLYLPNLHLGPMNSLNEAGSSPLAAKASISDRSMTTPSAQAQELASVPASSIEARRVNYGSSGQGAEIAPMLPSVSEPESAPTVASPHLQPMLESAPTLATVSSAPAFDSNSVEADSVSPHKSPTSEAYLFDALSKQMPEEDISNIIGK